VNLPLHMGWLGILEASLIALLVGMLCYAAFHWMARRGRWNHGHDIGWACLAALAIAAGIDAWHLFHMGVVRLESPVRARIVLARIHDADRLGARVFMETCAALAGVTLAWLLANRRRAE
jgi:hypothetical protein